MSHIKPKKMTNFRMGSYSYTFKFAKKVSITETYEKNGFPSFTKISL